MARPLNPDNLLPLVDALADGLWHSGEALAQAAGVTRAALAKRVQKLADWGLRVEARHGLGYRLTQPLERLDATRIRTLLPLDAAERLSLTVLSTTDSTNRQLLEGDARRDPQVLFAEHQSAGRGRSGRQWLSPFGANLYLSFAWSFPQWPAQLTALPLAVGVACARALQKLGLAGIGLKWPNDLLVDGRKLGGILIEQRGEAGGACRVVVGVGINVAMSDAQGKDIEQPWISLSEALAGTPSRNQLAAYLLNELTQTLTIFAVQGFVPFAPAWHALDITRDKPVRILGKGENYTGIARGVADSGALQVEHEGRLRQVLAGDVSLRLT